MIKSIFLFFSITSLVSAITINEVTEDGVYDWYMKGDRKVFTPHKKKIIHAERKKVIPVYVEKEEDNRSKDKPLSQEEIDKSFASDKDFEVEKEKLNVSSEAANFFESVNKKDMKPINLEK